MSQWYTARELSEGEREVTRGLLMQTLAQSYTIENILTTLGYPDPLAAARQHARMILLGRLARYQAAIQQLEARWDRTLEDLRARYTAQDSEDFAADDDYLQWQWYADAIEAVNAQLATVSESLDDAPVI
jgi:hypothetical protein